MKLSEYKKAVEEDTLPSSYRSRKLTEFICDGCGEEAIKTSSEYKRNIDYGKPNYCCGSCAAHYNKKGKTRIPSQKQLEQLRKIQGNRRDEYTPFRYTFRCVKRRFEKEMNIDLEYLKWLWEEQKGICPYSGLKLVLPEDNYTKDQDITTRASLDRIDSSKGYIKGNVQWVSTPINYMKSTMSDSQTKHFLKQISVFASSFDEDQTISSLNN